MRSRSFVLGVVLSPILLACGTPNDTPDTGVSGMSGESGMTSETGETGDPAADGHGSIRIEIATADDDLTFLEDTSEIVALVHYEACLQEFYLFRQPSYTRDGADGAPVFADWMTRLCSDDEGGPHCDVVDITQNLIEASDVYTLSVTLGIQDPSTIANRQIQVGPIPLAALAACEAGQQPRVELRQTSLIGRNAMGEQIWRIGSLPALNSGVADQAAVLRVEVVPL